MFRYASKETAATYPLLGNPNHLYYDQRTGSILGIVLHVTAGLQDLDGVADQSAESTNRYGATTKTRASWHVCVDSDSIAPALPARCTAWHVKGYNSRTFGLEISNHDARWDNKPVPWMDATLRNAAAAAAPIVVENHLPLQLATRAQVDAAIAKGVPFGFAYHSRLQPEDRIDPGGPAGRETFPITTFLGLVQEAITPEDDMPNPEDLWNATLVGPDGKFKARARDWLTYANEKAGRAARDSAAALAVVKALAAKPTGLTPAEIEAAAKAGAKAALDEEIDSATVTLSTTKEA